ncbi:hypothetical protein Hanom_Chr17g01557791 [Helianthus anomalus]
MEESEGIEETHNHVGASPHVDSTMHEGHVHPVDDDVFVGPPRSRSVFQTCQAEVGPKLVRKSGGPDFFAFGSLDGQFCKRAPLLRSVGLKGRAQSSPHVSPVDPRPK